MRTMHAELAESFDGGLVGWGGEGTGWDKGGACDDPVSTGGDCGGVRGGEGGEGEEGRGDFMAEEGARDPGGRAS